MCNMLKVCKYYLAAFCPNELLEDTKADMGKYLYIGIISDIK